jgi:ergothioneine biosynthesis protein EgtB
MRSTAETQKPATPELDLLTRYEQVRAWSLRLAEPLSAEDQMVQSMPDASPTKWHLAHTTWFFETFLLSEYLPGYKPFDPSYRTLFNSYYKKLGSHPIRSTRGTFSRPALSTILKYRQFVDDAIVDLFSKKLHKKADALLQLGINHEQQHQELILTDIKHAFWSQPLQPAYQSGKPSAVAPAALNWVQFDGGTYSIGHVGPDFAFDNESPNHEVLLQPFRLASRLVTNGEFLRFMEDGGYQRPELWLSEGWDTVCQLRWSHPLYWEKKEDHRWRQFTLSGMRPLELHEPVCHVSYFEADAYARWAGARLPREEEWEVAAQSVPLEGNFAESSRFAPSASPGGRLTQLFGDLWEWTASPYVAYPGFRPAAGAVGEYNGKFMCNQFVLRGGSCVTPRSHMRATYRNFFPAHARWQFTGIRIAADEC